MLCGTSGRTPPRRPALFVGRLLGLALLLALAVVVSAAPAYAGPCAPTSAPAKTPRAAPAASVRTLAVRVPKSGPKECEPSSPFKKRGNADPISFAFFIGIIVAVVLVPVALGRREESPPE
jgi:hypothetical protein